MRKGTWFANLSIACDDPDRLVLRENKILFVCLTVFSGTFGLLLLALGSGWIGGRSVGARNTWILSVGGLVFIAAAVVLLFYRRVVCADRQRRVVEVRERMWGFWVDLLRLRFEEIQGVRLVYGPMATGGRGGPVYTWSLWIDRRNVVEPWSFEVSSNSAYMHQLADSLERLIGCPIHRDTPETVTSGPGLKDLEPAAQRRIQRIRSLVLMTALGGVLMTALMLVFIGAPPPFIMFAVISALFVSGVVIVLTLRGSK